MFELQKRYCKDMNLSINVLEEPYFTNRLKLFGYFEDYQEFLSMIDLRFDGNGEAFLEEYNNVKDKIITFIKESEAFIDLNSTDMNQFAKVIQKPTTEVYKEYNIGQRFISIDMRKANFSSLVYYSKLTNKKFFDSYSYEDFIKQFTYIDHIIKSKYIRQVVFGNCNPKRQITFASYLMSKLLSDMIKDFPWIDNLVYSLLSDEIIIKAETLNEEEVDYFINYKADFPIKVEYFTLGKVIGSDAYIKKFLDGTLEPKCVSPDEAPFIFRKILEEDIQDEDLVFSHNGKLAKFLRTPEVKISYHSV